MPGGASLIRRLAADRAFDGVELCDAVERALGDRRAIGLMDVVELAPRMCPAGGLADVAAAIEVVEAGISVGLQRALESLQVSSRMLAFATGE